MKKNSIKLLNFLTFWVAYSLPAVAIFGWFSEWLVFPKLVFFVVGMCVSIIIVTDD